MSMRDEKEKHVTFSEQTLTTSSKIQTTQSYCMAPPPPPHTHTYRHTQKNRACTSRSLKLYERELFLSRFLLKWFSS